MIKEYTCIICPNSCELMVTIEDNRILSIENALCKRGHGYVEQELNHPQRNIATSIPVENGVIPLASVRLSKPIPKDRIFDAMEEIKGVRVKAPVRIGQVVIENLLGLDSDVMITKNIQEK